MFFLYLPAPAEPELNSMVICLGFFSLSATSERTSGNKGKTGLEMEAATEFFFGILKEDNMVNEFLALILMLLTRSLKDGIFPVSISKEVV